MTACADWLLPEAAAGPESGDWPAVSPVESARHQPRRPAPEGPPPESPAGTRTVMTRGPGATAPMQVPPH